MPSHTVVPVLQNQPHYSEEEIAENFEREIDEVSQDEEDTPNNPNGFPDEAVELLEARWPAWKEAVREKRQRLWKALKKDLKALPCHKGVRGDAWKVKAKIYHKWLQNKGRIRASKKAFYIGRQWTTRRVLEDRYKQQVIDLVKEQNGGNYVLQDYQPTLNSVLADVSAEEKAEAKLLAQEWNTSGGPGEVQTRFTKKNIYTVTKHFAEEMWKKGGVRMVIMAGWKDGESGEIFSVINDFNPEIANGPRFEKEANVQRLFEPYLRKCFGDEENSVNGSHGSEDEGSEPNGHAANGIKAPARRKVDREEHVKKVIGADGIIRVPEFDRGDRIEMLSLIRGFLTAHYRKACGNPKATVPFTKLSDFKPDSGIVDLEHVPFGWTVPRDPSKILKREAWDFLSHIQERQEEHGERAFRFNKWVDAGGHLQRNIEDPEFNPATVTKRPRPRPRVKARRVVPQSESDSESSESSDDEEEGGGKLPEQGPSGLRGMESPASKSDSGSSSDSGDTDDARPSYPNMLDPKGKGKEVYGGRNSGERNDRNRAIVAYGVYPELSYRDQAKIVPTQGHPKPGRQLLKPVLKRTYESQSDPNRNPLQTVDPEHSDTDGSDVEKIQKSLADPQLSEDAGAEGDGADSMPAIKQNKLPRRTIAAQPTQASSHAPSSPVRDVSPRTDGRKSKQADAMPGPERRSNRHRRAPLPRDADMHFAQMAGARKRKVSGNDRAGKKSRLQ